MDEKLQDPLVSEAGPELGGAQEGSVFVGHFDPLEV